LVGLLITAGCFPPGIGDGGELGTGTDETGDDGTGDGDGDGDPGDGDGDGDCGTTPIVVCSDTNECWASEPSWTAEAMAMAIDAPFDPGIWVPVNLGVGDQCWGLVGGDQHLCTVDICGEHLLGRPAAELPLEPSQACDFTGAWESTAAAYDTCFGLIDGVAVELRSASSPSEVGEMWGPCPTVDGAPALCNSDSISCVPADFGEANICLPLGSCPSDLPNFGTVFELGWGTACYPRCDVDSDCADGMTCAVSLADESSMCAWPR
jgi:hypothetical protein